VADTPDDALIEAIGVRIRHELKTRTLPPDPITGLGGMGLTEFDIARAAYAALVEHLELTEQRSTSGPMLLRRLVSKWVEVTQP
jgi:hypothetical protein